MFELTPYQQAVLSALLHDESLRSSQIHDQLQRSGFSVSLVTVKRTVTDMTKKKLISSTGGGRSVQYSIATAGRVFLNLNADEYCRVEPDKRHGLTQFNFDLLSSFPVTVFTNTEKKILSQATSEYKQRTKKVSDTIAKKELERLVIELAWKSSKIEGNTYTLLDTEKLLLEHTLAPGHDQKEAKMILNHKEAFTLVHTHSKDFRILTKSNLEHLHSVLIQDLGVDKGLRRSPVGITGSVYQPLDNRHQITDAIQALSKAIDHVQTPYDKALLALIGISYIQPFDDGNKRTARLMANALLMAYGCAPLSYRSVNEEAYRNATLVFYELNSIVSFKRIFVEQYDFAARNYTTR